MPRSKLAVALLALLALCGCKKRMTSGRFEGQLTAQFNVAFKDPVKGPMLAFGKEEGTESLELTMLESDRAKTSIRGCSLETTVRWDGGQFWFASEPTTCTFTFDGRKTEVRIRATSWSGHGDTMDRVSFVGVYDRPDLGNTFVKANYEIQLLELRRRQ